MNQYKLTEEEADRLMKAFDVVKKGLPYSTTVTAIDATVSLTTIMEVENKLIQQNSEFNTPPAPNSYNQPISTTEPPIVHQLDNGATPAPAKRTVVRRPGRRSNT